MAEPYIFQLSAEKAGWIFARQAVISANVANANSPGYKAQDVRPFTEALEGGALSQRVTNSDHIASAASSSSAGVGTVACLWGPFEREELARFAPVAFHDRDHGPADGSPLRLEGTR